MLTVNHCQNGINIKAAERNAINQQTAAFLAHNKIQQVGFSVSAEQEKLTASQKIRKSLNATLNRK